MKNIILFLASVSIAITTQTYGMLPPTNPDFDAYHYEVNCCYNKLEKKQPIDIAHIQNLYEHAQKCDINALYSLRTIDSSYLEGSVMHEALFLARYHGETRLLTKLLKLSSCDILRPSIIIFDDETWSEVYVSPWQFIIEQLEHDPKNGHLKKIYAILYQSVKDKLNLISSRTPILCSTL